MARSHWAMRLRSPANCSVCFGSEHQVLLARENLLNAPVVVEIDVPVLMFLDDGIDILSVVVCGLEFLEKDCEFLSCHFIPFYGGNAPAKADRDGPVYTIKRFRGENEPKCLFFLSGPYRGLRPLQGDNAGTHFIILIFIALWLSRPRTMYMPGFTPLACKAALMPPMAAMPSTLQTNLPSMPNTS